MNFSMIIFVLGWVLNFESVFMLLPALTGILYHEESSWSFLIAAVLCLFFGLIMSFHRPKKTTLYAREGYIIVAFSWILMSIFGAIPLFLCGAIPNFVDAVFESASGFTTTGATILTDVETLPKCCIFWRSFTHWVGGMGVLVFIMAFLPLSGAGNMNLMRAESTGPSVGKLVPKVRLTAIWLYGMYLFLTIIEFICLILAKMPVFDAINTAFSTAGTGGFGIKNDSLGSYNSAIQIIVVVFMILFGINFSFYFCILTKRFKDLLYFSEVRTYLIIMALASAVITWNIHSAYSSLGTAVKDSVFNVSSIMTSTGFSNVDFNTWPQLSRCILVTLMFIGACAGSTGGGIKVSRIMILFKTVLKEIRIQIHPKQIKKYKMDGREIPHEVVRSVNTYMVVFILFYVISVLLVALDEQDLVTTFTAVAATINNVGPGLELVGPVGNFSMFSSGVKCILIIDMIAGRLELFPILLILSPSTWKK